MLPFAFHERCPQPTALTVGFLAFSATGILAAVSYRKIFVNFTGTYEVVSSPDFAEEHLRPGYVTLRQRGKYVKGEYEIGTMRGTLNGGVNTDFIDFDFAGSDEMEDAFGEGEATLDGDHLTFELRHYCGDEFTFECLRRK